MPTQHYAVVDIETTGGMPNRDRITEVGIVITDGETIIKKYETLVNPERSIPPNITRITGITNSMVSESPKFYEVAKNIVELTEGCIFVAHNVNFDYNFLAHEFKSLGFTFTRRKLCTVVLSRKAFPEIKSHSLGNLIQHFSIKVQDRHRALDDAYAASEVLKLAMARFDTKKGVKQFISQTIKETTLPKNLNLEDIDSLPNECGVYYFRDTDHNIVYIGKSIDIQKRAKQHFSKKGKKGLRLFREVAYIDYTLTGSELHSLLLESEEIKSHLPSINVAQKTHNYPYTIISEVDDDGYIRLKLFKKGELAPPDQNEYGNYGSRQSAKSRIMMLASMNELCKKLCGLEPKNTSACFEYGLDKCYGACMQKESVDEYNERVELALSYLDNFWLENAIVIEYTHNLHEKVIFSIKDGIYCGHSIYPHEREPVQVEELINNPDFPCQFSPEKQAILQNYILTHPEVQIVEL